MQWGMYTAVAVLGPRVLPGSRQVWSPPMGDGAWRAIYRDLDAVVGRFDHVAVYEQPQPGRTGFGLLLFADGRARAFVKMRAGGRSLHRELSVLEALAQPPPSAFAVPVPIGAGEHGGWAWLALRPLPTRPHAPAKRVAIDPLVAELQDRLTGVLAVPPGGVAAHWRPAHGDLTAWNLRQAAGMRWLIDWEEACWAPPDADAAYYRATSALMRRRPTRAGASHEAVDFWLARIAARADEDPDDAMNALLPGVLRSMARGVGAGGGPAATSADRAPS